MTAPKDIPLQTGRVTNFETGDVEMSFPHGGVPVAKMYLVDLSSNRQVEAQFNPTQFSRALEVEYARQTVPGLSHKVLQYVATNNTTFELELFFTSDNADQAVRNLVTRRTIESFCYPRGVTSVVNGGPPRVLFVWPTFISLTTVLTGVTETYTRFANDGMPTGFTLGITLEEVRDVRMLSKDVLLNGLQRSVGDRDDQRKKDEP